MSYKILSIDGGGIRGVFALEILKMLQEDLGRNFLDQFDCFSGTSTGALIISALVKGYTPTELMHFYTLVGKKIFPEKRRRIKGEAKYKQELLQKILKATWSEKTTLADLEKHIIIPACRLSKTWKAEIYDNFDRIQASEWLLVDIALRSSAAPIYFPSYQNYIDGGVYALNPSLVALSRVLDEKGGNREIEDIKILSIGTGMNPMGIEEEVNWGVDQWMAEQPMAHYPLVSLLTDIGSTIPEYPLQQLLKERYLRINAYLPVPVEIDEPSKISVLRDAARAIKDNHPDVWNGYLKWF